MMSLAVERGVTSLFDEVFLHKDRLIDEQSRSMSTDRSVFSLMRIDLCHDEEKPMDNVDEDNEEVLGNHRMSKNFEIILKPSNEELLIDLQEPKEKVFQRNFFEFDWMNERWFSHDQMEWIDEVQRQNEHDDDPSMKHFYQQTKEFFEEKKNDEEEEILVHIDRWIFN